MTKRPPLISAPQATSQTGSADLMDTEPEQNSEHSKIASSTTGHPPDSPGATGQETPNPTGPIWLLVVTAAVAVAMVGLDRAGLPHEAIEMFLAFVGQLFAALLKATREE